MPRRLAAIAGLVVVVVLVLILLYKVWVHRETMEMNDDGGAIVEVRDRGADHLEKFAGLLG